LSLCLLRRLEMALLRVRARLLLRACLRIFLVALRWNERERLFMALKFKFKTKDEIPAELASHYVERDGGWVLDADGAAEKSKLDEFRTNNLALLKQLDEQKKKIEGIDPEAVRKLAEGKQRQKE